MGPAETSLPWLKGWRVSWDLFGLSLWHWRGWKNPRRIVDVETRLEEGKKMGARQERGTGLGGPEGRARLLCRCNKSWLLHEVHAPEPGNPPSLLFREHRSKKVGLPRVGRAPAPSLKRSSETRTTPSDPCLQLGAYSPAYRTCLFLHPPTSLLLRSGCAVRKGMFKSVV